MISFIEHIDPAAARFANPLSTAYMSLRTEALRFFTHAPDDPAAAVASRSARAFPRERLAAALEGYNAGLGAPEATMAGIRGLRDPGSLCVVSGQQAGFLGGPLYTSYKILSSIRIARDLAAATGRRVVPIFWLASEDHDFQEVNHSYTLGRDGVTRRISFSWPGVGRPLHDMPMTPEVGRALRRYEEQLDGSLAGRGAMEMLEPHEGDTYCAWVARVLLRAFGPHGLVVVEPRLLAPLAGPFYEAAFSRTEAIRESLRRVARDLEEAGFGAALDPELAGIPFRFGPGGMRVRSPRDPGLAPVAAGTPQLYSADAALRPILQDALLPTAVSVLGPGEIAYQAMLRPLYELFEVTQPVLLPRMSVTLMSRVEADTLARCGLDFSRLTAPSFRAWETLRRALPPADREPFEAAGRGLDETFLRLSERVRTIDANLRITAAAAQASARHALERLARRSYRALLARHGLSLTALDSLRASVFPRGSLQERVYPLPFLVQRHGKGIVDELLGVASPTDLRHHVGVAGSP